MPADDFLRSLAVAAMRGASHSTPPILEPARALRFAAKSRGVAFSELPRIVLGLELEACHITGPGRFIILAWDDRVPTRVAHNHLYFEKIPALDILSRPPDDGLPRVDVVGCRMVDCTLRDVSIYVVGDDIRAL